MKKKKNFEFKIQYNSNKPTLHMYKNISHAVEKYIHLLSNDISNITKRKHFFNSFAPREEHT